MLPVILIVHYDAYITKFSVPYFSCCLMYHNCVCFQCVVCGVSRTRTCGAFTGNVQCRFLLGHSCPSLKKSGLILMTFIIALTCCITAGMPASYILPKASCEGTYQINFLIWFLPVLYQAACDPYQKFNPITKEACFHRGLSTVLHYPSRASV
jgi:hypothetical protein